jgi:hypothetical protein
LWTLPFDAERSFGFGTRAEVGFFPCGCGGRSKARRKPRSIRRAISLSDNWSSVFGESFMARTIMPIFDVCQEEGKIVGRLLAGYGEIEFALHGCLTAVMNDINAAGRLLYRARGEENRIIIADAIMHDHFSAVGLLNEYCEAIADMGWCRKVRNQFAHAHWYIGNPPPYGLSIIDLDDAAKKRGGTMVVRQDYITLALLQQQEEYFLYVHECLRYLQFEYPFRARGLPSHSFVLPTKIARPPRYNANP